MKNIVREKTSFSKEGFPLYRRRSVQDLDVISYNRQIYLDWDGHCNIEFSGLTYTVLYLYKYLFKGPSKVDLSLLATPPRPGVLPLHPKDEIGRYIRGTSASANLSCMKNSLSCMIDIGQMYFVLLATDTSNGNDPFCYRTFTYCPV